MRSHVLAFLVLALFGVLASASFAACGCSENAQAASASASECNGQDCLAVGAAGVNGTGPEASAAEQAGAVVSAAEDEGLECGSEATAQARARCRLRAREEAFEAGIGQQVQAEVQTELQHMPEECRALNGTVHAACIARYRVMYNCMAHENDVAREACMKSELQLNRVVEQKQTCLSNQTTDKQECLQQLHQNVYQLIKFRFQNLLEKAERLSEKGASEELVVEFMAAIEQKTVEFDEAQTMDERKAIVQEVAQLWREFAKQAIDEINEARQTSGVS
jgi:hypothetical protein